MDGPGDVKWQGFRLKQGFMATPPREVIRWFPQGAGRTDGFNRDVGVQIASY
jgi:hypothetical protein